MIDRENYFSPEEYRAMIERYESLLLSVNRPGIEDLLTFIRKSDFYTAPASTKYHNAVKGGLLNHTLNVYDLLEKKIGPSAAPWPTEDMPIKLDEESIIIAALLHDICKTHMYREYYKNRKVYDVDVVESEKAKGNFSKKDGAGEFVWVTEKGYEIHDKCPYGHGEKSAMIADHFIELKGVERFMIRWHMGFSVPSELWATMNAAIEMHPEILAIFEADMETSHLLEVREEKD